MPRNLKTLSQLQSEINQLKSENQRLKLLLEMILEVAHKAVDCTEPEPKEETCLKI